MSVLKPFVLVLSIICSWSLHGQVQIFEATRVDEQRITALESELSAYDVFSIDIKSLDRYVHSPGYDNRLILDLPGVGEFEMDLIPNPVRTADYKLKVQTPEGVIEVQTDDKVKTFKGYINAQFEVRLTIDDNYISGFIETRQGDLMIESANLRDTAIPADRIITYYNQDVIAEYPNHCEPLKAPDHYYQEIDESDMPQRVVDECYDVEIALANDWLMYEERGENLQAVENHNMTVLNNVQSNYDNEFLDEVNFVISEIFVSTCSTCDPWSPSTSASVLLNSFSNWAGNGFGTHDVATLWTDRNFDGETIGLAWLSSVCFNNFKYNTCQDFTSNSGSLRVLQAHELGHNFSAVHDLGPPDHIMAPALQIPPQTSWSTLSQNDISDYVADASCLSFCASQEPPVADLGADVTEGCIPLSVQFEDLSEGFPSSWDWSFPGGTPSSSNEESPLVTYNQAGTYDVSLEVTNGAGTDLITLENYITVFPNPEPDFTYTSNELTIFFENLSVNADSYFWDFGDGEVSDLENPTHNYFEDGVYLVSLTASNACSSEDYILEIEVVSTPAASFSYTPDEGCVPLSVDFENLSSDNAITYLWEFDGGDPLSSSDENPTVVYNQPGVYSVTLTVGNSAGDDISIQNDIIVVNPLPVADFNVTISGNTVSLDNLSTDSYAYTWDFGDENMSNEFEPEHTYANGGAYTITLISEGDCGTDTVSIEVSISSAPLAGIGVSVSEGCAPLEVQYNSQSTGEVESYNWTFPGGAPATSSEENPVVLYSSPGIYSATLVVTNALGSDTVEMTNAVTIPEDVQADFSYDINGQEVQFVDESTNQQSIEWQIDGQVYTIPNPVVDFGMDGEFMALLIATGPCGSDTTMTLITIATPPSAGFTVNGGSTAGCAPFEVQFSNTSSENVSAWSWTFPGGNPTTSNVQNPVVVYEAAGVYSVSLVVTSGGGSDEMVMNDLISVGEPPDAAFSTNQSGTVVTFEDQSFDADEVVWFFGDGTTSIQMNPTHDYETFGNYEVMLIATNECGSDTSVFVLELQGLPVPDFSVTQAAGCAPFEVSFEDLSQNMPDTWEWVFPGGNPSTSNEQHPTVMYDAPGVYDVSLTASNSSGSESITRFEYIAVADAPLAQFDVVTSGDQASFINESEDAGSYYWDFGDGTTSELAEPDHVYAGSGTYLVTLIATNSCGSDTAQFELVIETTLYVYPELGARLEVWPNPNSGNFWLDIDDHAGELLIQVYDIRGMLHHNSVFNAPGRTEVNLREASPGMYIVILSDSISRKYHKIVVK